MSDLNPMHYDIRKHYFWQYFVDRLASYLGFTHTSLVNEVRIASGGNIELSCSDNSVLPLMQSLFQAFEQEDKIILPSYDTDQSYKTTQAIWLFIPELFVPEESQLLMKSYVDVYFPNMFPKIFTSRFLKNLNSMIDLKDTVRRAGVQSVNFTSEGVEFTWPIFFMNAKAAKEIITAQLPGISFVRNEPKQIEVLMVEYAIAWSVLSGTSWTGDLAGLFENVEFYKNVFNLHLSKVDTDKYSYCADKIRAQFGLGAARFSHTVNELNLDDFKGEDYERAPEA